MVSPAGDPVEGPGMILVFGSINIDLLVPVPLLPRPGETVLGANYALSPGGKGANQALAARRAGASVTMAGAIGDDAFAALALANLCAEGVDLGLVRQGVRPPSLPRPVISRCRRWQSNRSIRPALATPLSGCWPPASARGWRSNRRCAGRAPRPGSLAWHKARRPRCPIAPRSTPPSAGC